MTTVPGEHDIETFTGRYISTRQPRARQVCIEDIAHGLANTCRFGGQCSHFYSVAEHAAYCAQLARRRGYDRKTQLACLHHDDAEAYLGDIPRPMKGLLGERYKRLTRRMDDAIIEALRLPFVRADLHGEHVKEVDNALLMWEARILLPSQGRGWSGQSHNWDIETDAGRDAAPLHWEFGLRQHAAEALYLSAHRELMS